MSIPESVTMVEPANGNKMSIVTPIDIKADAGDMKTVSIESTNSDVRTNALGTTVYRPKKK